MRAELPGWLTAVERVYRTRVVDAEEHATAPDSARTDACVDVDVDAAGTAPTRLNTAAVDCVLALTLTLAGGQGNLSRKNSPGAQNMSLSKPKSSVHH